MAEEKKDKKIQKERAIIKLAHSYVVTLPIKLCRKYGVKPGDRVKVSYEFSKPELVVKLKK